MFKIILGYNNYKSYFYLNCLNINNIASTGYMSIIHKLLLLTTIECDCVIIHIQNLTHHITRIVHTIQLNIKYDLITIIVIIHKTIIHMHFSRRTN